MMPIAESPATPDEATGFEDEPVEAVEADTTQTLVHVALALYLTPVIVVVCLIGGVSIMLGKAARIAERLASRLPHRDKNGHWLAAAPSFERGRHPGDGRERTRIGH